MGLSGFDLAGEQFAFAIGAEFAFGQLRCRREQGFVGSKESRPTGDFYVAISFSRARRFRMSTGFVK
jgi:hypothetical protein